MVIFLSKVVSCSLLGVSVFWKLWQWVQLWVPMWDNSNIIKKYLLKQMESQRSVVQHISILESQLILQSQMVHVNYLFHQLRDVKLSISGSSGLPTNQPLLRHAVAR